MFYKIIIFSILFFAGCKTKTSQELININKDFSLKELSFNKTTSEEFEKLMANKKILFTVKETTPEDYLQNDSIAFCGNDSRLYEFNKIYTNDSLGLIFNFLKSNQQNKYTFYEYEISKFHHIKINKIDANHLNNKQLKELEIMNDNAYDYIANSKILGSITLIDVNDSIKKINYLKVTTREN